jgi:hypothetical protein
MTTRTDAANGPRIIERQKLPASMGLYSAADAFGLSRDYIRGLGASGEVRMVRRGRKVEYAIEDIARIKRERGL